MYLAGWWSGQLSSVWNPPKSMLSMKNPGLVRDSPKYNPVSSSTNEGFERCLSDVTRTSHCAGWKIQRTKPAWRRGTWCWWRHPPRQFVPGAPRFPVEKVRIQWDIPSDKLRSTWDIYIYIHMVIFYHVCVYIYISFNKLRSTWMMNCPSSMLICRYWSSLVLKHPMWGVIFLKPIALDWLTNLEEIMGCFSQSKRHFLQVFFRWVKARVGACGIPWHKGNTPS